ncbi:MAG: TetR family transcriptional regulator [Alphaproteobacteria bacterium]|nr:TetR family transcriptional regulator [Alphaproteobacteria bacterium]
MAAAQATKRSTAAEPRSHAARREEAERAMLRAAVMLIAEKGIAGLTLNDVGEAAGYSRGLPAHYFGTRDQLVGAVARHMTQEFARGLGREAIAPGLAGTLRACDAYLRTAARDPTAVRALMIVFAEATAQPGLFPDVIDVTRGGIAGFHASLKAGQAQGEIRRDIDPRAQAALILGQLRGVVAEWLMDPKLFSLDRARSQMLANLRRSLMP